MLEKKIVVTWLLHRVTKRWMKFVLSPDIILRGWLGSKHQLTDLVASVVKTYSIAWNGCRPHSLSCYWHRPDVLVLADSVVKTCFIAYMSADHTIMALASTRCPTPFFHGIGIDQTSLSLQPLEWWPAPLLNMAADHTHYHGTGIDHMSWSL